MSMSQCKVTWVFKEAGEAKLTPCGVAVVLAKQVIVSPKSPLELS